MAARAVKVRASPLVAPKFAEDVCLEIEDNTVIRRSAAEFFGIRGLRDAEAAATAARLAEQFIQQNHALAARLGVGIETAYDGREVALTIRSTNCVGAVPLASPTSARPDYGLVISPRFPWPGIGPMLAAMGWRITPTPLKLPLLRRSERRVPRWVLSSMILVRVQALLDSLDRRFEIASEQRRAPRGRVDWSCYAQVSLPRAQFLSIPCTFPDLRDDRMMKGAIRHTLEQQIHSLETQKEHGGFVHRLIAFADQLLQQVRTVPIYIPSGNILDSWRQRPLCSEAHIDGLTAIEWSFEERGLAGLSDLEGIPWVMPMDQFFEAWVETLLREVARTTGGRLRAGRNKETTQPIAWEPPFVGSQRSLVPDLWLEWEDLTLIVDAKYKRHFEELQRVPWMRAGADMAEQHRQDLLQVLAYGNLAQTSRVIACLAYPCSKENWLSLKERNRLVHRAELSAGSRSLELWLTAVPMSAAVEEVSAPLIDLIRTSLPGGH